MDLSIIIPAYNVEKYLKRCIDSLIGLNNNGRNDILYEIIIVNDGSTDNTLLIAEEIKKIYYNENIIIINQENKGPSIARNVGIKKARGKYISFIDSDDFVNKENYIKFIHKLLKDDVEIAIGNYKKFEIGEKINFDDIEKKSIHIKNNKKYRIKTGKKYYKWLYKKNTLNISVIWEKIYKKDFLIKNNLFFKKDRLHEDEIFNVEVFLSANRVKFYEIYFYNYIIRKGSITTKKSDKNFKDLEKSIFEIYDIMNKEKDKQIKRLLYKNINSMYKEIIKQTKNTELSKKFLNNYKKLPIYKESIENKALFEDEKYLQLINKPFELNKDTKVKDILFFMNNLNKNKNKNLDKKTKKVLYQIYINMLLSIDYKKEDLKKILKIILKRNVSFKYKLKLLKKYINPKKYENRKIYNL